MNSRRRLIAGFLIMMITSAVAGGLFMRWWTLREMEVNRPHVVAEKFQSQLGLNAAQTKRVEASVAAHLKEVRDAQRRDLKALAASKRKLSAAVRTVFTPEQRRQYDEFQASLNTDAPPAAQP